MTTTSSPSSIANTTTVIQGLRILNMMILRKDTDPTVQGRKSESFAKSSYGTTVKTTARNPLLRFFIRPTGSTTAVLLFSIFLLLKIPFTYDRSTVILRLLLAATFVRFIVGALDAARALNVVTIDFQICRHDSIGAKFFRNCPIQALVIIQKQPVQLREIDQ